MCVFKIKSAIIKEKCGLPFPTKMEQGPNLPFCLKHAKTFCFLKDGLQDAK